MSYVCDWCDCQIPEDEITLCSKNNAESDEGDLFTTGPNEGPDVELRIYTEHPKHYHEECMARAAVYLLNLHLGLGYEVKGPK